VTESWESWTLDYELMEKPEVQKIDFWRTAKTCGVLKVINGAIGKKELVTIIMERIEKIF
jgi:hypothetical protein